MSSEQTNAPEVNPAVIAYANMVNERYRKLWDALAGGEAGVADVSRDA